MLATYLTQVTELLQNPAAPSSLYATSDLTNYLNTARQWVAGQGECIRTTGNLTLAGGTQSYPFSGISITNGVSIGIGGVNAVRQVLIGQGTGYQWIEGRGWEWFTQFGLNNINPDEDQPSMWSQLGQGQTGSIWFSDTPDGPYTALCDVACYPVALVDDATVEAIPPLWTLAVPFFAAYLALLSAQSATRQADADRMLQRFEMFMQRARAVSTPSVLPGQYPQNNPLPAVPQTGAWGGGAPQGNG